MELRVKRLEQLELFEVFFVYVAVIGQVLLDQVMEIVRIALKKLRVYLEALLECEVPDVLVK